MPPSIDKLERLLGAALGRPVRIADTARIDPWSVQRCRLAAESELLPRSVIAKWRRDGAGEMRADLGRIAAEQASLEFLAEIGFAYAPKLIAADADEGVLILEDLYPRESLAGLMRSKPPASLVEERRTFARLMGELGAASAGKAELFNARRAAYGPFDPLAIRRDVLWSAAPHPPAGLDGLGLPMSGEAQRELARVAQIMTEPGPFLAFSNGDPDPNNLLVAGLDGRLIDFEAGGFRHALTCARWIYVPGAHWITVADPLAAELEDEYRASLAAGIAAAGDDRLFGMGLSAAAFTWALLRLDRFFTLDSRPAGDPSRIQMISTLESAAGVARRHRALPALAGWVESAAAWLRRRWRDADVDLSRYPPYSPRN